MANKGRILVVDDEKRWRDVLRRTLQRDGYQVDAVGSAPEAMEHLDTALYHMLILDIRLQDQDSANAEGMHLLDRLYRQDVGIGSAMQVIMLSAYGTKEEMRSAFRTYNVADFVSKDDFDNLELLDLVNQIFEQDIQANLAMTLHWQNSSDPADVVIGMWLGGARVKRDTALQSRLAAELEELLRRLFATATSLVVRPLLEGMSGTRVLRVQPFFDKKGAGQSFVVKFGAIDVIKSEEDNFRSYVQTFIGGRRTTTVLAEGRTRRLSGIVYSFVGAAGDSLENFKDFYCRSEIDAIERVIDNLFTDTCTTWYANAGSVQPYNLTLEYTQNLSLSYEQFQKKPNAFEKCSWHG